MPGSDLPDTDLFDIIYFDKWVHVGMFGLLTIAWCYPFLKISTTTKKLFFFIAACVILYGIAMEFVQEFFTTQRSFDLYDILADAVGAGTACFLLIWLLNKQKMRGYIQKNEPL